MQARVRPAFHIKPVTDNGGTWMSQGRMQVFHALVEAKHVHVAFLVEQQIKHYIGGRFALALRKLLEIAANVRLVARGS